MNRRSRSTALLATAIAGLFAAAPALAKGGDDTGGYLQAKGVVASNGIAGGGGATALQIASQSGDAVLIALPTDDGTALARATPSGGAVRSVSIDGGFTIPTVALDKSTSGLSADGSVLVLAQPLAHFPQRQTRFEILDARSLRVRDDIVLPGSYSFDAISPDGDLLYLIQYTSPSDPSRYLVRAYNVSSRHVLRAPVVDPSESGRPMTGKPVTRAMSPDGRWAYTLYQGSDEGPFVHALDTTAHRAVCVDLDAIDLPKNLSGSRLAVSDGGGELSILRGSSEVGRVDTQTFTVSSAQSAGAGGGQGATGAPWPLIVAIGLAMLALAGLVSRTLHRRRRLASS
jgi:hypothetical protein